MRVIIRTGRSAAAQEIGGIAIKTRRRTVYYLLVLAVAALTFLAVGYAFCQDLSNPKYTSNLTIWPNKVSKANSDDWIAKNHDKIKKMEPRILVVNFANGLSKEDSEKKAKELVMALNESTKYHGYKDKNAKAFVEWKILKIVDLTDPKPYPETPDGNCTKYPRKAKEGMNFSYKDLFSDKFAEYYGFKDPKHPDKYLKLSELVDRGIIHELWFQAYQRSAGAPFESIEWKPVYDDNFKKVGNEHRMAGNGGDPDEPWYGRSLRIMFMNAERGPGCATESLSHSFEGMAHCNCIPYFRKYFYEFAGFDLDKRWGLPWNSLYAVGGEGNGVSYPDPHTAVIKQEGKTYTVKNYYSIGGNVHWTPNGRGQYDLGSPYTVMSTIEHYRLFDGPDGKDKQEPWTIEKFQQFKYDGDCDGPFLVYWRQNMPGYNSPCKDDNKKQMKNWWPFLFY
jgi:hypothetical protein